jgi:hypothetical protein
MPYSIKRQKSLAKLVPLVLGVGRSSHVKRQATVCAGILTDKPTRFLDSLQPGDILLEYVLMELHTRIKLIDRKERLTFI